jgi:hypothetical protein
VECPAAPGAEHVANGAVETKVYSIKHIAPRPSPAPEVVAANYSFDRMQCRLAGYLAEPICCSRERCVW